jgi:tetratricopeptide (TPR) repeat protein
MPATESRRVLAAIVAIGCCLTSGPAQAQPVPPRPALEAAADPNDWNPYFDLGVELLRSNPLDAAACFYWAARLAPGRAEPLYAQWVAFWMRDERRWIGYLNDDKYVLRRPEVVRADSLRYRAYLLNPFVHQGLTVLLFERLPGAFRGDVATKGWLAYAAGDLTTAADKLGEAIAKDSVKYMGLRQMRASALVSLGHIDGALAEMQALLRQLRQREDTVLVRSYESKELVLYSIGMLLAGRGRTAQARDAYRQALVENLGFAPAHRALARLVSLQGDPVTAVSELAQAVELDGGDAVLRYEYGAALLASGKSAEAVVELRRSVAMEPWWAEPYYSLGKALEATGAADQALAAYQAFVARAHRGAVMLGIAQGRIVALSPK